MIEIIETDADALNCETLAKLCRMSRMRNYMSQLDLTYEAGMSSGVVAGIETGRVKNPQLRTLTRLFDALGYELVLREKQ